MGDLRLNLHALRRRYLYSEAPETVRFEHLMDASDNDLTFTRRQALKSAGIAATFLTPVIRSARAMAPQLHGPFSMKYEGDCITFYLGKTPCWTIDAARFSGSPTLTVKRTDTLLKVELSKAFYPGTRLQGDFVLEVRPRLTESVMKLRMALGGFQGSTSFEKWLAGEAKLVSDVTLGECVSTSSNETSLKLRGCAKGEFQAGWKYKFRGNEIGMLEGFGSSLVSNEVFVRLPDASLPSSFASPDIKRSLIELERGDHAWDLVHGLNPEKDWGLNIRENTFDGLLLESVEREDGNVAHAVVAEQSNKHPQSSFTALGAFDSLGDAFKLPLARARYAVLFDGDHVERAFEARYHSEPQWLHGKGCSFLVGGEPQDAAREESEEFDLLPTFEIYARDGVVEHLHCEPALLKVSAPLGGAIVEPAETLLGTRLVFSDSKVKSHPFLASYPLGDGSDDQNPFRFPANFVIGAVRPDDLLVLKFEFINMEFQGERKGLKLVKTKSKSSNPAGSYLIVHFPSQNIAEEAFYVKPGNGFHPLTAAELGQPGPPIPSPPFQKETGGDDSFPPKVPARARLSGESRLAFYLPDGVDSLPYSLDGLLNWTSLQASLVPASLPPKPPPAGTYLLPAGAFGNVKLGGIELSPSQLKQMGLLTRNAEPPSPNSNDLKYRPNFVISQSDVDKIIKQNQSVGVGQNSPESAISNITQNSQISGNTKNDIQLAVSAQSPAFPSTDGFIPNVPLNIVIREPHLWETSLETPWRLMLSPNYYAGWAHSSAPVGRVDSQKVNWVELWHTRLGIKRYGELLKIVVDEQDDYYRTLRAIWSPDYEVDGKFVDPGHFPPANPNDPGSNIFRMSLDGDDRHQLVQLTSDFTLSKDSKVSHEGAIARYVRAESFMMSSLGAWMNLRYSADAPLGTSIEEWRHRSTMGRDHYVRVVYKGYLFPFGHPASLIKVTERKFESTGNYMTAVLRQRMFIVVRQPIVRYPGQYQPGEGRSLPFSSVEVTTLVTPDLEDPKNTPIYNGAPTQTAFWPYVDNGAFRFHCKGTDWEGKIIEFTAPLGFVDNTVAYDHYNELSFGYTDTSAPTKTKIAFGGQKIAFAESKKSGDTTFETTSLTFAVGNNAKTGTTPEKLSDADEPAFYPTLEQAEIHIESVKQITGRPASAVMSYYLPYLDKGWDSNPGEVFFQLVDHTKPIAISFGNGGTTTDKVGGIATPNMSIIGLSRLTGTVSGNGAATQFTRAQQAQFDPTAFFPDLSSLQLFGGISLGDVVSATGTTVPGILPPMPNNPPDYSASVSSLKDQMEAQLNTDAMNLSGLTADALDALGLPICPVPCYITQTMYDNSLGVSNTPNGMKIPTQIQIVFKWDPEIQSGGPDMGGVPLFHVDGDPKNTLSITALIVVPINKNGTPGIPITTVLAKLTSFTLNLFGIVSIQFNSFKLTKDAGKKANPTVDVGNVEFTGQLSFLNELESIIPSDGFSDPPDIQVTAGGLIVGYTLGIPTIGVGAFSLQNISLGAELDIPFTGDPIRFRFHFCTKDNPFLLTIYCLGGGGFFGLELGPDGYEMIEASFEFGAAVSIDLGVASGGVSIMAGVYFQVTTGGSGTSLVTGFFQFEGNLELLGIVSVSVELYISLTYQFDPPPKELIGSATLTLSAKVLFFSVSVSVSVTKVFADPVLGFADWFGPPASLRAGDAWPDPAQAWADYREAFSIDYLVTK